MIRRHHERRRHCLREKNASVFKDTLAFFETRGASNLPTVYPVPADTGRRARIASDTRRVRTEAFAQLERDDLAAMAQRLPGAAGVLSDAQ